MFFLFFFFEKPAVVLGLWWHKTFIVFDKPRSVILLAMYVKIILVFTKKISKSIIITGHLLQELLVQH